MAKNVWSKCHAQEYHRLQLVQGDPSAAFPTGRTDWPSSEDSSPDSGPPRPDMDRTGLPPDLEGFMPDFLGGGSGLPSHLGPVKQLYCRTGYNLVVDQEAKVYGTREHFHESAVLEMSSDETGVVRIRGVQSGFYVAMNDRGRLYGEADRNNESTLFYESLRGSYNTYISKSQPEWYIAIKKSGKPKRGDRTAPGQKAIQFLPRPATRPN